MISYGFLPLIALSQITVSGNIHPNAIEIDKSANVYPGDGDTNILNPGATLDWVKNSSANTDAPSLIDSIATGIKTTAPNQTGAPGGTGNWNGVRIVDGFGGGDQNIFTKGGKVNEPLGWVIAPGSIGSSKYDATQMYIANNQSDIFFGMERNGNNGTTAFDWEFNQKPPLVFVDDPATTFVESSLNGYVPDRSNGDVLITFEMQGSGNASGSVQTFIFKFDGDDPNDQNDPVPNAYVQCNGLQTDPAVCAGVNGVSVAASINGIEPTPAEPWGYVNGGSWILSPGFPLRFFAEAKVSLSLLPGINVCGGSGFVAVRTRASATLTSDAKDTTKYFEYNFGGPTARATLTSGCGLNIRYDGTTSTNSTNGSTGLSYSFQFQRYTGPLSDSPNYDETKWVNEGSAVVDTDGVGDFTAPQSGAYRAILTVTQTTACSDAVTTNAVIVFPDVGGTASLTGDCDDTFTFTAQGTGGSGSYAYEWSFYKENGATDILVGTSSSRTGTIDIDLVTTPSGDGDYYAIVRIRDANNTACFRDVTTNTIQVRHPLTASASKTLASTNLNMADASFSVTLTAQFGNAGSDSITKQWQQNLSGTWTNITGANSNTVSRTMADIITFGTTGSNETATILSDPYSLRRSSLELRIHAERTLNGSVCEANSAGVIVKALKGIDP